LEQAEKEAVRGAQSKAEVAAQQLREVEGARAKCVLEAELAQKAAQTASQIESKEPEAQMAGKTAAQIEADNIAEEAQSQMNALKKMEVTSASTRNPYTH
jgi:hypothetical protein